MKDSDKISYAFIPAIFSFAIGLAFLFSYPFNPASIVFIILGFASAAAVIFSPRGRHYYKALREFDENYRYDKEVESS